MSEATHVAWPTVEEVARALEMLNGAYAQLLDTRVAPSLSEGSPAPTVNDLGVLAVAIRRSEFELEVANRFLGELREKFRCAAMESPDFDRIEDPESFARVQAAEAERRSS